jgi:ABC-type Fe3+/spermidine/putrescine transport system ATPase subunit
MDEPLSALDKNLREEMQLEIKRLQSQLGITVVFVTHDQGEALTMADRVAILDKGRILQLDAPKALYETPKTRFVAGFMGETNFIPVRIESAATSGVSVRLPGDTLHDVPAPSVVGRTVAGAQAVAAVRPEQVALGGTGSAAALPATVTGVIYSGATVLCIAQLADGSEMRARLSDASRVSVKSGDRVHLSWPAEALRIYGEEVVA